MKTWQVLTAIGVGSFLAVLLVCGGMATWMGIVMQQSLNAAQQGFANMQPGAYATVPGITYSLQGPHEAIVNQPFTLEAIVENNSSQVQTIHSIDSYSSLRILSSQPAWQNRQNDTYVFNLDVQPGQMQIIRFEVEPVSVGYEDVNLDANINSPTNFTEAYHGLDVKPAPPTF